MSSAFVGVGLALPPRLEGRFGVAGEGIGNYSRQKCQHSSVLRAVVDPAGNRNMFVDACHRSGKTHHKDRTAEVRSENKDQQHLLFQGLDSGLQAVARM